jgi:hypothetical protein
MREKKFEGRVEVAPNALPRRLQQGIDKYCEAVREDMIRGLKKNPRDNLTPQQRMAMEVLQEKVRRKQSGR